MQQLFSNAEVERLKDLVLQFREAIRRTNPEKLPISMCEFPKGSAGDASELLAIFLRDQGFAGIDHVIGWHGGLSYAWLEIGDVLVDITADQWNDVLPVVVSTDQSFRAPYVEESRHPAIIEDYDEDTLRTFQQAYREVVKNLPADTQKP